MSIQRFEGFTYSCDHCHVVHRQENAHAHYSNSTPPGWITVVLKAYDIASKTRLLCEECSQLLFTDDDMQQCFDFDPFHD